MTNPADDTRHYITQGGISITRTIAGVDGTSALAQLTQALDQRRGLLLASSYEYPGRYKRYDIGFVDPPLAFEAVGRAFELNALNARGKLLLPACSAALRACQPLRIEPSEAGRVRGWVPATSQAVSEEQRTRLPSVFCALRALRGLFSSPADSVLGLYGAFGYDLVFQFESLRMRQPRAAETRDLVLYLPDQVLVIDHEQERARLHSFEFETVAGSSAGLARETQPQAYAAISGGASERDHAPGEFAREVERARGAFSRGDLFEVTPSQLFTRRCPAAPSQLFVALRRSNPAPYGFLVNLGASEFLVGASPEMYVRVQQDRVETCPIAGTIARGADALADAQQIRALLESDKDEAELTMCTDVDRNDKARICRAGSVRVIGRRQIELYSRLIHTVDHVEGRLREGYDSLDAFVTHLWAVTVTGAPKRAAMQFIEDHERSPRGFYGAAVGMIGFDGSLNTGLTLRTLHIARGLVQLRVGATLHYDSDSAAEEAECELKASALFAVLDSAGGSARAATARKPTPASELRVLIIDHQDSFVHTLGDYFRQSGCQVTTLRCGFALSEYERLAPELVVLSPGPSRPSDFGMHDTLAELLRRQLPVFGVCLGLQGMVEFCGGRLAQLATPVHGKPSFIACASEQPSPLFEGLPARLRVGRYHSLHADVAHLPAELAALAHAEPDGCIMAVAHRERPWYAVQFHPESILSADAGQGLRLIENVVGMARARATATARPGGSL